MMVDATVQPNLNGPNIVKEWVSLVREQLADNFVINYNYYSLRDILNISKDLSKEPKIIASTK
jgi:hypothetical protein